MPLVLPARLLPVLRDFQEAIPGTLFPGDSVLPSQEVLRLVALSEAGEESPLSTAALIPTYIALSFAQILFIGEITVALMLFS
jgi:hypothetical protein